MNVAAALESAKSIAGGALRPTATMEMDSGLVTIDVIATTLAPVGTIDVLQGEKAHIVASTLAPVVTADVLRGESANIAISTLAPVGTIDVLRGAKS